MGDVLTAIREKAHAHQVESKAKRFRDRGGLWQPLSPSKNKLMAFLNSAELQNIIEDSPSAKPKAESSKAIPPDDKPKKLVQDEVPSAPPKTKGRRKAPQVSLAEKSLVIAKTVSGAKSRQKRKTATVFSDPTTSDGKTDHKQVQPQTATGHTDKRVKSPRRSKRATNKRNPREMSDEEDVLSDFRPSPAKKPRTRAAPKISKEAVKVRPVKSSTVEDKHSMQTNDSSIARGKIPTIPDSSPTDMPADVNTSRSLKHSLEPSDADEPSTAKRRRTRNVRQTQETLKATKQPNVDHSDIEMTSENELSKPRKRSKPASKASTKSSSRKRPTNNCHEEPRTNSDGDVVRPGSNKPGFRDGLRLETIQEEEEIEHNNRVVLMGLMKSSVSVPQASGSKDRMQTLGMTKRRRKKVKVKPDDSDAQLSQLDQEVDQGLGASTDASARCAAGPHTFHDSHRLQLEKDVPQVSKTQASKAHLTSKSKPKDNSRASVTHHEDIGVVPPVKRSKRKTCNSEANEVSKPSKRHRTMKELNKPSSSRERHLEPEVDSDLDEIDFLT